MAAWREKFVAELFRSTCFIFYAYKSEDTDCACMLYLTHRISLAHLGCLRLKHSACEPPHGGRFVRRRYEGFLLVRFSCPWLSIEFTKVATAR
jgi:hypothetical protein